MSTTATTLPHNNTEAIAHQDHGNATAKHDGKLHLPNQLLRVRVIGAVLDNLKSSADTYAVVSIGNQSARTKVVKDSNRPIYEENFAIGYEFDDTKSEVVVDVFEKGLIHDSRIGEFRLHLGQVDPPKARKARKQDGTSKESVKDSEKLPLPTNKLDVAPKKGAKSWTQAQPREAPLLDNKGARIGTLSLLVRREERIHGNLHLQLSNLDLAKATAHGLPWAASAPKLVVKLGETRHESQEGGNIDCVFNVDDTNNISDIFVELWQQGEARAEGRLPLYDIRKGTRQGEVNLIGPFGGHDVTDCSKQRYEAGVVRYNSTFNGQQA